MPIRLFFQISTAIRKSFFVGLVSGLFFSSFSFSQDVDFQFNDSSVDVSGQYTAVNYVYTDEDTIINSGSGFQNYTTTAVFGSEANASFLSLAQDDFIGLSNTLAKEFDASYSSQISLRFRFDVDEPVIAPSPCCPTSIYRTVLGSNEGDQRALGFTLSIRKELENYYPLLLIGSGTLDEEGELREGYSIFFDEIVPKTWIELSMTFHLGDDQPRIDFLLDGTPTTVWLTETRRFDVEPLIDHLQGGSGPESDKDMQLFLGGYPYSDPRGADIELDIDWLTLQSPVQGADAAELNQILSEFTQHVTGASVMGSDQAQLNLQNFFSGFQGDWDGIQAIALEFTSAFEDANEPLFAENELVSPADFEPEALLAYYLQQWMFDNLYTAENVDSMSGIKFEAAEIYPGTVSSNAPRVQAVIEVDADYHTDPGINLNDQEAVFRPTGYYAPPGEIITIEVPEAATAAGLQIRLGLQRFDMEQQWTVFNRFPRISNVFEIDSISTTVANPFGGGIYIIVPDGTDLGIIDVTINDAVKIPMYSTLPLVGHSQNLQEFRAETEKWHVPWFELHSENFSTTIHMNVATLYQDPAAVLSVVDSILDEVNRMAGRPLARFRAEWLASDRFVTHRNTAMAASYPTYPDRNIGELGEDWLADTTWFSPLLYLMEDFFDPNADLAYEFLHSEILWHEWGHLHNLPTLGFEEQESNVHLLAYVAYRNVLGADADTAMQFSGPQHYDRDDAALDTMLSPNWLQGERLSYDTWDNELRYQTRSWARLVEIGELYGWDAVGSIHGAFYQRGVEDGTPYNYGITDDDFIETASAALNMNLSPIFDFWGVPPSPALAASLAQYPLPEEFRLRLLHYRTLVPRNHSAFVPIYNHMAATTGSIGRWDYLLENLDESMAEEILNRVDAIECRYFGCDGDARYYDGLLVVPALSVGGDSYRIEFSLYDIDELEFQVGPYELLSSSTFDQPATYADGVLTLPRLTVEGTTYRVELTLTDAELYIFKITDAQEL